MFSVFIFSPPTQPPQQPLCPCPAVPADSKGNSWHRALLCAGRGDFHVLAAAPAHCTEMSTSGASQKKQPKSRNKADPEGKPMLWLPIVPGRHGLTGTTPSFLCCWTSSKQCFCSLFHLGYNCKQHWLYTLRKEVSNTFISLSNPYFVLLQHSRSNLLTHFHSLYRIGAAPPWGFCSSYSSSVVTVVG